MAKKKRDIFQYYAHCEKCNDFLPLDQLVYGLCGRCEKQVYEIKEETIEKTSVNPCILKE